MNEDDSNEDEDGGGILGTRIPGTATRGEICVFSVGVTTARVMAFQHKSGLIKDGITATPPTVHMIVRLEQQRRPPLAGCWMIRDIIDAQYATGGNGWSRDEGV